MSEREPYPELDCALAMRKALGNLEFLLSISKEEWRESFTSAQAIEDAFFALVKAQEEYDKVLTLLRESTKL